MGEMGRVADKRGGEGGRWGRVADGRDGEGGGNGGKYAWEAKSA